MRSDTCVNFQTVHPHLRNCLPGKAKRQAHALRINSSRCTARSGGSRAPCVRSRVPVPCGLGARSVRLPFARLGSSTQMPIRHCRLRCVTRALLCIPAPRAYGSLPSARWSHAFCARHCSQLVAVFSTSALHAAISADAAWRAGCAARYWACKLAFSCSISRRASSSAALCLRFDGSEAAAMRSAASVAEVKGLHIERRRAHGSLSAWRPRDKGMHARDGLR